MFFKVYSRRRIMLAALALLALFALLFLPFLHARSLSAFSSAAETRALPVIMYHSLLKEQRRWNDYVISPELLEQDIVYLKSLGYTFISMAEAVAFVKEDGILPEKPILLTLDDGYLNNYLYLPDILERQDARAVVSVVGEYSDVYTYQDDHNPTYAYMSWPDIKELSQNPRIEIGNHSYYFHHMGARSGAMRKSGESKNEWLAALRSDTLSLQSALTSKCGVTPTIYTYPYGKISKGADEALAELGFSATLSCNEKISVLRRGDDSTLLSIGRFNRPAKVDTQSFFNKLFGRAGK